MKKKNSNPGGPGGIPADIDPVTRDQVNVRAHELALIAGRAPPQVSQRDYEQAKRDVTGTSEMDQQDAILDAIPEEKRGDPLPSSTGHQIPEPASEDEDDEGRSASEQLVEKGVADAERDQVLQSAIEAAKKRP